MLTLGTTTQHKPFQCKEVEGGEILISTATGKDGHRSKRLCGYSPPS